MANIAQTNNQIGI